MAFPSSALTAGNYTSLRGTGATAQFHAADYLTCLCPNTVVFKALVNGAPSGNSYAQVTFDNVTTGAYTDIKIGQTVLIGSDSDKRNATFVGRVRKTPTSTILYVNETSVSIADNANIWVIDDYRVWDKLTLESAGVMYKDYDETYQVPKPIIYNLQSAYAGVVSGSPEGYTIAFSASAIAGASGSSITAYSWSIGDGTVTAGATNTANVTVRFPSGFRWISLTVTQTGSITTTRRIPIWAIPTDYSSQVTLAIDQISITGSIDQGWNASLNAWSGVDTVLDNTLVCLVRVEYYGTTQTSILNNVAFIGRIRTENNQNKTDDNFSRVMQAGLQLEGLATQMSREEHLPFALVYDATPTAWDEINNLTIWRAIAHCLQRHTTVMELHSLSFSDTSDSYLADQLGVQGGNMLAVIRDLAESINGVVEFAPTGELRVVRDAVYLSTASRSALLTYGAFTNEDYIDFTLDVEHNDTIGLVQSAGGSYQTASDTVLAVLSTAPGLAQNTPEGTSALLKQILTADQDKNDNETELNARSGHHLAAVNPTDTLNVTHPSGYGSVLVPSRIVWYTFTIASTENTRGRAYTTSNRWLLNEVTLDHDNQTGITRTSAVYKLETSGAAGRAIYPPAYAEESNALPIMFPFTPYSFFPEIPTVYSPIDVTGISLPPLLGDPSSYPSSSPIKADGNTVLFGTANRVYVTRKFITSNTIGELDITPSTIGANEVIKHAVWGAGYDAYLLTYDTSGDNSYVWYTDNVLSLAAGWTKGAALSGQYEFIRKTATQGALYVIGSRPTTSSGAYSVTWDFTLSNYGFRVRNDIAGSGVTTSGRYSLGNGFQCYGTEGTAGSGDLAEISITSPYFPSSCTGITGMSIDYNQPYSITLGWSKLSEIKGYTWTNLLTQDNTHPTITGTFTPTPLATGVNTATATIVSSTVYRAGGQMRLRDSALFVGSQFVAAYIRSLTISGNGVNGLNRTGQTRYSTDYGATFAAAVDVGTFPGGGFMGGDTSKIGTQIIATKDDQSRKASSGGAYSDYGSAIAQGAIVIPRYEPASTTTDNSGSTPKHVVFASEISSSESMWYWNGASYTAITPTESSIEGLALSPHCIDMWWRNGNYMACIAAYEGSYRLKTSTNGGTSWTDRAALSDSAAYVRFRKGDTTGQQLFFSDGTPYYSSNAGSTKQAKTYPESPTTAPVLFIEPYG